MTGVQQVSARVEELLDALKSGGFGGAAPAAEELVGLLVGLYGDGLTQIVTILAEAGPDGAALVAKLADDPLVESLLLLHGLHPLDVDARIQRALDRVRPYLGSHAGGVEYLGVVDGVARLKLEGSCSGCPSSTVTVQLAIEGAVRDAAPEVTDVVVEGMTAAPAAADIAADRQAPGRGARRDGAGSDRERGRLGDPAEYRAAEFQAGQCVGGRDPGHRLLGPRHAVRLSRCLREVRLLHGRRRSRPRGADVSRLRSPLQRAASWQEHRG